jgi:hypothetical protein
MRRGLLNAYLFYSLAEVGMMAEEWQLGYSSKALSRNGERKSSQN